MAPLSDVRYKTSDVLSHCLPRTNVWDAGSRLLCATPNCADDALTALGSLVKCAEIESRPDETGTWEMCVNETSSECSAQKNACEYAVVMETSNVFKPEDVAKDSDEYTQKLASYLNVIFGGWDAILEAYVAVVGFGLVLPVALGFVWLAFLFLFAGFIIYSLVASHCPLPFFISLPYHSTYTDSNPPHFPASHFPASHLPTPHC